MLFWFDCRDDLNPQSNNEGRRNRFLDQTKIDIRFDNGKENLKMTYVPTPVYISSPQYCSDTDSSKRTYDKNKEVLKDFPATDNEKEARFYIRRIICAKLTLCMKKGLVKEEVSPPLS